MTTTRPQASDKSDRTHFNEDGAHAIAGLIVERMRLLPQLAADLAG